MKLTTEALEDITDNVSDFEDAATARWLAARLEPARMAAREVPSVEAIARMRARIFGEAAPVKKDTRIAA